MSFRLLFAVGLGVVCVASSACGASSTSAPAAAAAAPQVSASASAPTSPASAAPNGTPSASSTPKLAAVLPNGELSASATFQDWLDILRAGHTSSETCLLHASSTGSFRPGIASSAPVPAAADVLADAAVDALFEPKSFPERGLRLVTRWGKSEGGNFIDLVALTPVARSIQGTMTPVVFATKTGVRFAILGKSQSQLLTKSDVAQLQSLFPKATTWVVTAAADAPLSRVHEALGLLRGAPGNVVLAAPIQDHEPTRRLGRHSRFDSRVPPSSPGGCPAVTAGGVGKEGPNDGRFGGGNLSRAVEVLTQSASKCGAELGAGSGGNIHVMLRVSATGSVMSACAETDDTEDAALRTCVLGTIKQAKLPHADSPPGPASFGTSFSFAGKPMAALCP